MCACVDISLSHDSGKLHAVDNCNDIFLTKGVRRTWGFATCSSPQFVATDFQELPEPMESSTAVHHLITRLPMVKPRGLCAPSKRP